MSIPIPSEPYAYDPATHMVRNIYTILTLELSTWYLVNVSSSSDSLKLLPITSKFEFIQVHDPLLFSMESR